MKTSEKAVAEPGSAPEETSLVSMQRQFDRLFSEVMNRPLGSWLEADRWFPAWTRPNVDLVETDKDFEVTAELPGVEEKDLEVKITDGSLVLEGKTESETEEKGKTWLRHERRLGAFSRTFTLPSSADPGKAKAKLKNGVLTVTVPKKPEARTKAKKIQISTE